MPETVAPPVVARAAAMQSEILTMPAWELRGTLDHLLSLVARTGGNALSPTAVLDAIDYTIDPGSEGAAADSVRRATDNLAASLGGEPIVTYGHTGNGDPTGVLITGGGVVIAVSEGGRVESSQLPDVPWTSGVLDPAPERSGEDGDDLPPAPEIVALDRIRGVVAEPNIDGIDAIETVEQIRLYLDYLDNPVLEQS